MNSIREIQRLNKLELEQGIPPSASWHVDYRDTAYVHIGGLPFDLTEGDIITIFSQFGEPTFVKLARDKTTGKSRGFGWLKYEDQRSCDLAVDNLGGATVLGRIIKVDHAWYKKRDDESEGDGDVDVSRAQVEVAEEKAKPREEVKRPPLREEMELQKLLQEHDDDDPMKGYLVSEKKEEVRKALEKQQRHVEKHRERRSGKSRRHKDHSREQTKRERSLSEDSYKRERTRRHRDGRGQPRKDSPNFKEDSNGYEPGRNHSYRDEDYRGEADGRRRRDREAQRSRTPVTSRRRKTHSPDERGGGRTPISSHQRRERGSEEDYAGRRRRRRSRSRSP